MHVRKKDKYFKKSGFTIIELIVVIVVIGILAALVVVAYNGIADKAKEASLVSDMDNARKRLEMYKVDFGYYPDFNDCSAPESTTTICLKTSPNNSIDYQSDGNTYTMYGSINNYPNFFKATEEIEAKKFTGWRQISAGYEHTCGIYYNGKAYCWGRGNYGVLGNGFNTDQKLAVAVSAGAIGVQTIRSISSGYYHTCAIASDNKVYCWGHGQRGQLGNGFNINKNTPVAVLPGEIGDQKIKSIVAGLLNTCAIASDNKAYCWGHGGSGTLGNGDNIDINTPVAVLPGEIGDQKIRSITTAYSHSCVIASDNKAYCWGYGSNGQLGNGKSGSGYSENTPVAVLPGSIDNQTIRSITAGDYHTCVINIDNKAYCWGLNSYGQLGNGYSGSTIYDKSVPDTVLPGDVGSLILKSIISGNGSYHTCAISSENKAYCWGLNNGGQLGIGSNNWPIKEPDTVLSGDIGNQSILSISTGNSHTCAIAYDNKAYCWGKGEFGRLGNGSTSNNNVPVLVKNP